MKNLRFSENYFSKVLIINAIFNVLKTITRPLKTEIVPFVCLIVFLHCTANVLSVKYKIVYPIQKPKAIIG